MIEAEKESLLRWEGKRGRADRKKGLRCAVYGCSLHTRNVGIMSYIHTTCMYHMCTTQYTRTTCVYYICVLRVHTTYMYCMHHMCVLHICTTKESNLGERKDTL